MARTPDKPGTFRIRQKGFEWILSGVKANGGRVRIPVSSQFEGEQLAATLFPNASAASNAPNTPIIPEITNPPKPPQFDEWGLPVVTTEQAQTVAGAMGIPPDPPKPPPVSETDKKVAEVQAQRKKYAKSLCELMGHAYAGGVVMGSHRLVSSAGKSPVKPSPKQVSDLAEVTADTIKDMFGDHEVKPWIMMVLLTIGIPLSMYIQSPKKQLPAQSPTDEQSPGLRSVT